MNYLGLQIARGEKPGVSAINKFGSNPACSTSWETVWDQGGLYPWDTGWSAGSAVMSVSSTSLEDASTGLGAKTIQLQGLSSDMLLQYEMITMNGATPVASTSKYKRLFRMKVVTAGTKCGNVGTIDVKTATSTGVTVGHLAAASTTSYMEFNQTQMALYTIPAGKIGYLTQINASLSQINRNASDVGIWMRESGCVFRNVFYKGVGAESPLTFEYPTPLKLPALTDIEVRAATDQNTANISADINIILFDEDVGV